MKAKSDPEAVVREIRRKTRKKYTSEEKRAEIKACGFYEINRVIPEQSFSIPVTSITKRSVEKKIDTVYGDQRKVYLPLGREQVFKFFESNPVIGKE